MLEDALDDRGGHLLDEIHRVIHIQLVQDLLQLRIGEGFDKQLLLLRLHLHKYLRRQLLGQQPVEHRQPVLRQLRQDGRDIRRFQEDQHIPYIRPASSLRQLLYLLHERAML